MRATRQLYYLDREYTEAQVKWMLNFSKGAPDVIFQARDDVERAEVIKIMKGMEKHLQKNLIGGQTKLINFKDKITKWREGLERGPKKGAMNGA